MDLIFTAYITKFVCFFLGYSQVYYADLGLGTLCSEIPYPWCRGPLKRLDTLADDLPIFDPIPRPEFQDLRDKTVGTSFQKCKTLDLLLSDINLGTRKSVCQLFLLCYI